MDASSLVTELVPPLDGVLVKSLLAEFLDVERRFILRDWEPATLNGGQFAEIAARIIYHVDSGNLNRTKGLDPCLNYVEDEKNQNSHTLTPRRTALHLCKALRTTYKFRSQRGAVHIDPDYTANELDSMLIVGIVRWVMSEILRVFWRGSTAVVASAIREIVRFDVPAVLAVDGRAKGLRTDCTVEEEILILLNNAGEAGMTRKQIGAAIPKSAPSVTLSLQHLCSPQMRQVLALHNGNYILTPNGQARVRRELADKLALK